MRPLREFWLGETSLAPVALFRILYGLQLVNWVWQLFPNLTPFFTDEGILPRSSQLTHYADRFTLLDVAGTWWQVAVFWAAALMVGALLTIGWRSRTMSFLAFIVVTSFSWRDPLILDGSDIVFRVVPLWLAFTECGARWSLDAVARRRRGEPARVAGPALPVRILELQIAWIYLSTGIDKLSGQLWPQGVATYYALQLEHTFGRPWAYPIATDLVFAQAMSWGTLGVELLFLPLAMVPARLTRVLAAAGAAGLHLGILTLMNVGNFPVIMLSALVLFLPPEWIERSVARATSFVDVRARPTAVAVADGVAEAAVVPAPIVRSRAPVRGSLAGLSLVVVAACSFVTAVPAQLEAIRPTGDVASLLRFLSLDQRWDMFAPDPARSDGWLRIPATLADATRIDLVTNGPVDDRIERYSDPLYSRWTKVTERIASASYSDYRLEYARQFCRARNLHLVPGEVPLETFEIHYVERVIRPPGEGPPTFRDILLWSHRC
ncbi:MAG TPA: HTTM domain-containing protein [Candidatus Limnocylindria bacterium]